MSKSLVHQLVAELSSYGIVCTAEQAHLMIKHLELLVEKNKVLNLTRIVDPVDSVTLHLVDSLLPLACNSVTLCSEDWFVDMGTGGGFPGVPLAVKSGSSSVLIDSVGKKVNAVNEFLDKLGLSDKVHASHQRLEELGTDQSSAFQYVFARALAQTDVLIEYATPYLCMGGKLVVQKGRPDSEELKRASKTSSICGLKLIESKSFELPRSLGHREVLVYQKVCNSKIKLPRRTGMAKSSPLAL